MQNQLMKLTCFFKKCLPFQMNIIVLTLNFFLLPFATFYIHVILPTILSFLASKLGRAHLVDAFSLHRLCSCGTFNTSLFLCYINSSLSALYTFAELYTKRMFQLLMSAYSTISVRDTALFLGMNEEAATNCKLLFYLLIQWSNYLTNSELLFYF
uniref:Uncharacterized protein n=1 Tax=Nelumbo nucifera TaxID=4432 RepID=A0A822Z661_NELNU|nr:TPA_asm: hypothetical protein HUJ06_014413 [Nelumbo nucifera]